MPAPTALTAPPEQLTQAVEPPAFLLRLVAHQLHEHQQRREDRNNCADCGEPWPCAARNVAQSVGAAADPAGYASLHPDTANPARATEPVPPLVSLPASVSAGPAPQAAASWWTATGTAVGVAVPAVRMTWPHQISGDGAADLYLAPSTRDSRP